MKFKDKHIKAMHFAQEAHLAIRQGKESDAINLFYKAFKLEKEVAFEYIKSNNEEPIRSILLKSAAALANNSKKYREAEKIIGIALAGNPPDQLANEIRDLYETINFNRHLVFKGIELDYNEIFLSLSGNEVGYGLIRADEFISRAQIIEKLTYRIAERKLGKPYRTGGKISKKLRDSIEPYYQAPMAASFAIKIKFGKPTKQIPLFPNHLNSQVIDELFQSLSLFISEKSNELRDLINDEAYYLNFLSLSKKLLPDGNRIKQVGFSIIRNGKQKSLGLIKSANQVNLDIFLGEEIGEKEKPIEITGFLKKADAIKNKITLISEQEQNKTYEIFVPKGLDDIVKLYWDSTVNVRIIKSNKNLYKLLEVNEVDE